MLETFKYSGVFHQSEARWDAQKYLVTITWGCIISRNYNICILYQNIHIRAKGVEKVAVRNLINSWPRTVIVLRHKFRGPQDTWRIANKRSKGPRSPLPYRHLFSLPEHPLFSVKIHMSEVPCPPELCFTGPNEEKKPTKPQEWPYMELAIHTSTQVGLLREKGMSVLISSLVAKRENVALWWALSPIHSILAAPGSSIVMTFSWERNSLFVL